MTQPERDLLEKAGILSISCMLLCALVCVIFLS